MKVHRFSICILIVLAVASAFISTKSVKKTLKNTLALTSVGPARSMTLVNASTIDFASASFKPIIEIGLAMYGRFKLSSGLANCQRLITLVAAFLLFPDMPLYIQSKKVRQPNLTVVHILVRFVTLTLIQNILLHLALKIPVDLDVSPHLFRLLYIFMPVIVAFLLCEGYSHILRKIFKHLPVPYLSVAYLVANVLWAIGTWSLRVGLSYLSAAAILLCATVFGTKYYK